MQATTEKAGVVGLGGFDLLLILLALFTGGASLCCSLFGPKPPSAASDSQANLLLVEPETTPLRPEAPEGEAEPGVTETQASMEDLVAEGPCDWQCYRDRAREEQAKRDAFVLQAKAAIEDKRTEDAKQLAAAGAIHHDRMQAYDQKAMRLLFDERNARRSQELHGMDLFGLTVDEAVLLIKERLSALRKEDICELSLFNLGVESEQDNPDKRALAEQLALSKLKEELNKDTEGKDQFSVKSKKDRLELQDKACKYHRKKEKKKDKRDDD